MEPSRRTTSSPDAAPLWVRLGIESLDPIAARLGPRCTAIPVSPLRGLAVMIRRLGPARALARAGAALLGADDEARRMVAVNVARRRIRLPWIYGWRPVLTLYAAIKRLQARLVTELAAARLEALPGRVVLNFNGSKYPESCMAVAARRLGRPMLLVENGHFPGTFQADPVGINAASAFPRDPAVLRPLAPLWPEERLPRRIGERADKLGQTGRAPLSLPEGFVFVPFQVPSDSQVLLHSPWIPDMRAFHAEVVAAAEARPDLVFVIKEHPSFKLRLAGKVPPHPRVIFANAARTPELIERARAVVTLNSTVGIEALVLERPVIVLGEAIFAIDGLVLRAPDRAAFHEALGRIDSFRPDPELRRAFLGLLHDHWLVPGSWRDPDARSIAELDRRAAALEAGADPLALPAPPGRP